MSELAVIVPGSDDGDDTGCGRAVERERDRIARRFRLRLADREVDDVHPVGDSRLDRCNDLGCVPVLADPAIRRNRVGTVVPDVGAWRDTRDERTTRGRSVSVACGDSGDMRAVRGARRLRVERDALGGRRRPRGRERARDDHLRRRERRLTLREARRHRVAGRIEEWMALVDAAVDDADLHPVAGVRETWRPQLWRADLPAGRPGQQLVAARAVDVAHSGERAQPRDVTLGQHDRCAVECDAVAPADPGSGNVSLEC